MDSVFENTNLNFQLVWLRVYLYVLAKIANYMHVCNKSLYYCCPTGHGMDYSPQRRTRFLQKFLTLSGFVHVAVTQLLRVLLSHTSNLEMAKKHTRRIGSKTEKNFLVNKSNCNCLKQSYNTISFITQSSTKLTHLHFVTVRRSFQNLNVVSSKILL